MRKFVTAALVVGVASWGIQAHHDASAAPEDDSREAQAQVINNTAQVCFEDMPCWDCRTMGNMICGSDDPIIAPQPAAPIRTEPSFVG
jgi:hypothetical protein